jgi:ectoine hydroxylase-related dioxygenase (phytanoyl-CoA dioxygenase family)
MDDRELIPCSFAKDGFAIFPPILNEFLINQLLGVLAQAEKGEVRAKGSAVYALRDLLAIPAIEKLAHSKVIRRLITAILGDEAFPVRGLLFDKVPEANWKVPWHQDQTIAVQDRHDVEGYGPWTIKAGIHHVQPPLVILERMVAIRLHLDDCGHANGPLRVIPGSHLLGRIRDAEVPEIVSRSQIVTCEVPRGGALVMRPLLLHASSPAVSPGHRRVIHLEYASGELADGLQWHTRG